MGPGQTIDITLEENMISPKPQFFRAWFGQLSFNLKFDGGDFKKWLHGGWSWCVFFEKDKTVLSFHFSFLWLSNFSGFSGWIWSLTSWALQRRPGMTCHLIDQGSEDENFEPLPFVTELLLLLGCILPYCCLDSSSLKKGIGKDWPKK